MPICTEEEIAPEDLITLVSCNCKGECSNNHCTCKKNNVACTDFYGCGDSCQNSDMCPTHNLGEEEDDEEDVTDERGEELGDEGDEDEGDEDEGEEDDHIDL